MIKKEERIVIFILLIYYIALVSISFIAAGTADDGDSLSHFLFARYAFSHPENFFNQWAKPVYVLIAAPFAQFGFHGIEIFNITISVLTIYFTYRTAKLLTLSNAWFVVVTMCCAPMYLRLTISGLTEPLFALALVIVIFLVLERKLLAATLLASFLPFFRSEGLIIISLFALYLLISKKWKLIPLLIAGHVVYSVAGYWYHKDFLWVFHLTYATLHSAYGSGSPMVFVNGMVDYLGWPLLIFFYVGALAGIIRFGNSMLAGVRRPLTHNPTQASDTVEFFLVYGSFFGVWISHMIFWKFGLFNSFGLIRVLIQVIPCAALISTRGFNDIIKITGTLTSTRVKQGITITVIAVIIFVPLVQLNPVCDFGLTGGEKAINKAAAKYKDELNGYTLYYTAPYISLAFNSDFFDSAQHRMTSHFLSDKQIPEKSAVIWDMYAAGESRVALGNLLVEERLQLLDTFIAKDCLGYDNTVAVFKYAGSNIEWLVKDTIYQNQFDTADFAGRDWSVFLSGKYSAEVDEKFPYSPGLNTTVGELNQDSIRTLQISGSFYTRAFSSELYKHTQIVVSLDHGNKSYFWQGFDVTNLVTVRRHWTPVSFRINVPPVISMDDVLKVYVWNTNATPMYVDDFIVEVVEREKVK